MIKLHGRIFSGILLLTYEPFVLEVVTRLLPSSLHSRLRRSNLHRQPIHAGHVGENKAQSAAKALRRLNPLCAVEAVPEFLSAGNAPRLVSGYDVVVDATDNPATRSPAGRNALSAC